MSTKIYNAYRVREGVDAWDLVETIREAAEDTIQRGLRTFYIRACKADRVKVPHESEASAESIKTALRLNEWATEIRTYLQEKKWYVPKSEKLLPMNISDYIKFKVRDQQTSYEKNVYNLQADCLLFEHAGRFYLIAFSDHGTILGDVLGFIPEMDELEDYRFQNQSDMPEDVSLADWQEREQVWEAIYSGPHDTPGRRRVNLEILSLSNFSNLDPWMDMMAGYRDREAFDKFLSEQP